jgi:hypothetical protein
MARPIYLIDANSIRIANVDVHCCGDHFEGTIVLVAVASEVRQLFEHFEEIVEGQMFSLLDEVEEKIRAIRWRAVCEDGSPADIEDLQIFPSSGAVSFKLRQPTTVS